MSTTHGTGLSFDPLALRRFRPVSAPFLPSSISEQFTWETMGLFWRCEVKSFERDPALPANVLDVAKPRPTRTWSDLMAAYKSPAATYLVKVTHTGGDGVRTTQLITGLFDHERGYLHHRGGQSLVRGTTPEGELAATDFKTEWYSNKCRPKLDTRRHRCKLTASKYFIRPPRVYIRADPIMGVLRGEDEGVWTLAWLEDGGAWYRPREATGYFTRATFDKSGRLTELVSVMGDFSVKYEVEQFRTRRSLKKGLFRVNPAVHQPMR